MYEVMRTNNKCDVFGIEKMYNGEYKIFKYDSNAIRKDDAILYDDVFIWCDIKPFATLETCYKFMISHLEELM